MDDRTDPRVEPQLSRAETLACAGGSPDAKPEPEFPIKDWDRYEFLRFLGQGGMGMVFLARDRKLGREVAIKFVRIERDAHLQRFMVEARAQARVDHEHVCKVFEVGEVDGKVFITMQYIPGTPLDAVPAGLSLEQKVIVLRDAALGVHEAHRVGIIHRDLKPSNIMVERAEDGSLRTFVMDFGLAKEWNQDVTETGSVLGTPAYMSPEQARGDLSRVDRRADIYGLGATLYQVTTGRAPFIGANTLEILSAITSTDVLPMRHLRLDIPRDLEAITLKCLEKEPSKRYDSAKALADDLDRFLAGDPVLARSTGLWYRIQRKLQKRKQLTLVGALSLVVVLVALGAAVKTRRDAGRRESLAQQFTEAMARIESTTRYSALAPLHDIRPDLQAVRAHMAQLQADMQQAGSLANGPGNYALGRGYWTLDDAEQAREHLQMAWDAGYREPRVAYALAVVLGRQYQEKLLEAERISSADQREARKKNLESTLRAPALTYLRRARGSDVPSPAYLEALMAFYEGRLDEALDRLKTLQADQPWFYEAPLLRGSLLQARAWKQWNRGAREAAQEDFAAGRAALAAAAGTGRSAPAVYAALAELELNVMFMEKYGQGQVEPAYTRGMAAIQTALAAQSDHVPSLILEASLLGNLADFRMNRGERVDDLAEQGVAQAWKAVEAGPSRADAWIALGKAYYLWGNARASVNLDPTDQLMKGMKAFESLASEKRDYTVWNHLGLLHQTWAGFEDQQGRDPTAQLSEAIAAYEVATRLEPHLLPAWINLGTCFQLRAAVPRAAHPEGDLQAALKVLDQARTLNPKHLVPYFVLGQVRYALALRARDRGEDPGPELTRSIELTRQGIAINAGIPQLHNGEGLALLAQAQAAWDRGEDPSALTTQAQACFRRAIKVAPNQDFGYLNLTYLLIWKGRYLGSASALQEADLLLRKALKILPDHKGLLATQGWCLTVRAEQALPAGRDPTRELQAGEAALAKALAQGARDRDSLHYLGELRSATAAWQTQQRRADRKAFDLAAEAFQRALEVTPDSHPTLLAMARLYQTRAAWELASGADPGSSLAEGRSVLERVLKARPQWGEALALRGSLLLEEAESLPPSESGPKARAALKDLSEAFALNKNLVRAWKPWAERAQRLERRLSR
ncbi:serine/threonine-protein kinase [Geothrix fuzhouensis]|uniref:serine/threonine-protein kinase n=1 Tax=Geothrix fuzhouensis TaxID=2966451 RepID=UPI0021489798|nr:serine/threonine-protein kinase [Geothrix fuzhouensis]